MKAKLKFIIPIIIAVIAIIVAALCIDFTPTEKADIPSLVSTAQKYLIENNYEQAIAEFNKIIEIDPMNVDAYIGIADAYIGMGDTEKAIEWLEKGYALTSDERIKNMIDELNYENYVEETVDTTVIESETEPLSEEAASSTENRITYADGWYSIFKYENKNIVSMELYDKLGNKRLNANYEYIGNDIKRTVYVDDVLYETTNVEFRDIMVEVEKAKKERANTREEHDNNWWVYDENGNCIEHGWHDLDANGNTTDDSGGEIYYKNGQIYKSHSYFNSLGWDYTEYYDEKGYPLSREGKGYEVLNDNITYSYKYDNNGYPIIQYENGEFKGATYMNYYHANGGFAYYISQFKNEWNNNHGIGNGDNEDRVIEKNEDGYYLREMIHQIYNYNTGEVHHAYGGTYSNYYIPAYDGKIIDIIYVCAEKPLFECHYCYSEED